jgi:hypothetical protein
MVGVGACRISFSSGHLSIAFRELFPQVVAARLAHHLHLFRKITAPMTNQQMQPQQDFFA